MGSLAYKEILELGDIARNFAVVRARVALGSPLAELGYMAQELGRTAILADDDDDFICLATHALQRGGYSVLSVRNGHELLSRAREEMSARPVDSLVVIADLEMPGLTGLEAARLLLAEHASLPILLVTANFDTALVDRARSLGVLGVMSKPVPPRVLTGAADSALCHRPVENEETLRWARPPPSYIAAEEGSRPEETRRMRARAFRQTGEHDGAANAPLPEKKRSPT